MTTAAFNAITYANKLKDAGMQTRIADVQAEEMSEFLNTNLVTREMLSTEMSLMEMRLQSFIGRALVTAVSVVGIIQGIFHFIK